MDNEIVQSCLDKLVGKAIDLFTHNYQLRIIFERNGIERIYYFKLENDTSKKFVMLFIENKKLMQRQVCDDIWDIISIIVSIMHTYDETTWMFKRIDTDERID